MKPFILTIALGLAVVGTGWSQALPFASPFPASGKLVEADATQVLEFTFGVPEDGYLYREVFRVAVSDGTVLQPEMLPPGKKKLAPTADGGEAETDVYEHGLTLRYPIAEKHMGKRITLLYQGCRGTFCYREEKIYALDAGALVEVPTASVVPPVSDGPLGLQVVAVADGYLNAASMSAFLDAAASGKPYERNQLRGVLERGGILLLVLAVLAGGLALNLTPCVLPMIPINIAIIGAGAQAGSRKRGFLLGSAFGGGMAFVYGMLGVIAVVAGSQFGTLNSSPWFNGGIAVLFVVMALAMFDVLHVDLSRFQKGGQADVSKRGSLISASALGAIMALLAGACVAPVVISVLLLAVDLNANGNPAGLMLPLLLGVGMALPWPFAGAGLSFLPKPGTWMNYVKYGFGVLILLFAVKYAVLTYQIVAPAPDVDTTGWFTDLDAAQEEAETTKKLIFIDFWAVWCTNCKRMEATTFKDPEVLKRLDAFVKVKVEAELSRDAGRVLRRFGWEGTYGGLPVYAVVAPKEKE